MNLSIRGFTLIELLVVIAVIGVLAGAVVVLINPAAMLDRARIAKGKSFQGQLTTGPLNFYNVGAWNFNDSSNYGADTSGNNLTATINGATHVPNCDLGFGGCMSFDGVNNQISINDNDLIDFSVAQNFTVSFWVKDGGSNTNGDKLVEKWSGGGGYPYVFRYSSGKIIFARYDGTNNPGITSTTLINDDKWHLITGVKNGSNLTIYIDAVANGNSTDTTSGTTTNTSPLYIGCVGAYCYKGYIDEIYIFNQSLSQAMIHQLYARGVSRHVLASNNL